MAKIIIKDFMTTGVISVRSETPLLDAAKIIIDHNFNGVPVVDANNVLKGVLTQYNLVSKDSVLHLPTLQYISRNLQPAERASLKPETEKISGLTVEKVMNADCLTLLANDPIEKAVEIFSTHHAVNPIPVIDTNKKLVGLVSRFDLIKPLMMLRPEK